MRIRIPGAVAGLVLLLGTTAPAGAQEQGAIEPARTAARSWLALLDGYEFGESWRAAGEMLKGAVTQEEFSTTMSATLGPLGAVTSRGVKSSEYSTTLPGTPEGEYVILKFDTVFENKFTAVETVVLKKEPDGLWRVSGYRIL